MAEMKSQINLDDVKPGMTWKMVLTTFMAVTAGIWMAAILIPSWMPGITASILGSDVKVFWYISRGSAVIAYALLWFSMILGLLMTNRIDKTMARTCDFK